MTDQEADTIAEPLPAKDEALEAVRTFILNMNSATRPDLVSGIARIIRESLDTVLMGPTSGRWRLDELEKTEKTYIGTRIEISIRSFLGVQKGKVLDLLIDGHEVDIKCTTRSGWMIPREAIGQICLLVMITDSTSKFSIGLVRASSDKLNKGKNQDGKTSLSLDGRQAIVWLIRDQQYPANIFAKLSAIDRDEIFAEKRGTAALAMLFRKAQGVPISRSAVELLGSQKDPMKRIRANGGVRDRVWPDLMILQGRYDKVVVKKALEIDLAPDEAISISPAVLLAKGFGDYVDIYRMKSGLS